MTTKWGLGAGSGKPQDGQAIYIGGTLVGFMITRSHGWDAVTAQGTGLGRFNSEGAAATALIMHPGKGHR